MKRMRFGLGSALKTVRGMRGYSSYGATHKAILFVGLTTGLDQNKKRDGQPVDEQAVAKAILAERSRQIGFAAGQTVSPPQKGTYKGKPEASIKIEIADTGEDGSPELFERNVKKIAETIATEFAQRAVLIEWTRPKTVGSGKKKPPTTKATEAETAVASPRGAPGPTDPKFCEWVRARSTSARTDTTDDCYEAIPKRKRSRK